MAVPLTREQQDFRRAVREFAERVAAPSAAGRGPGDEPAVDVVRRMAELGLFGLPFPSTHGGLDADITTLCLTVEELARADAALAELLVQATAAAANVVSRAGSPAQKDRWLTPMSRGHVLGALVPAGPVTARETGEGWVLDRPRALLERAGSRLARLRIVAARTSEGAVGLFVVPLDEPTEQLAPEALLGEPGEGEGEGEEILLAVGADVWLGQAAATVGAHLGAGLGAGRDDGGAAERVHDAYLSACRLRDRGRPYRAEAALALDMARDLRVQGSAPG